MNWHFEQRAELTHPSGVLSYPDLMMAQGDNLAHTWRVQVYSGGQPMDLTGYTVTGYFDRSDGKMVPVIGSAVGHVATVVMPQSVYAVAGSLTGLLRASKGEQVITLAAGRWNVRKGPGDEIVDPGHVVPTLDELLAKIDEMERQTNAANGAAEMANEAAEAANEAATAANTAADRANAAADGMEDRLSEAKKAILDKVCPPFEQSGSVVQCYPVEGDPLEIVTQIEAVQEGTGNPSPDNVRPIVGWDSLTLTRNDDTYTQALPETVYGGSYNWTTGELVVDSRIVIVDGTGDKFIADSSGQYWNLPSGLSPGALSVRYNNHFPAGVFSCNKNREFLFTASSRLSKYFTTAAELNTYCKNQYDLGTPLQIAYRIKEPEIYHLTPQQILAIPGVNTLSSNAGDTTVSGRADPIHLTQSMLDRISALEGAQTGL